MPRTRGRRVLDNDLFVGRALLVLVPEAVRSMRPVERRRPQVGSLEIDLPRQSPLGGFAARWRRVDTAARRLPALRHVVAVQDGPPRADDLPGLIVRKPRRPGGGKTGNSKAAMMLIAWCI